MDNPIAPPNPNPTIGPSVVPSAVRRPLSNSPDGPSMTDQEVTQLLAAMNRDNVITDVEFSRYEKLYNREQVAAIYSVAENTVEKEELEALAEEFAHRFNQYKPIYVTNSAGEILFSLPPLYRRLDHFDNNIMRELLETIFVGTVNDDNNRNSIANIQKDTAIAEIGKQFSFAINGEKLSADSENFKSYSDDFYVRKYAEMYNVSPEHLRDLITRHYNGEAVVFPWQEGYTETPASDKADRKTATSNTSGSDELPMDIFG